MDLHCKLGTYCTIRPEIRSKCKKKKEKRCQKKKQVDSNHTDIVDTTKSASQ